MYLINTSVAGTVMKIHLYELLKCICEMGRLKIIFLQTRFVNSQDILPVSATIIIYV